MAKKLITSTSFLNVIILSINRSRFFSAVLEGFSGKRITISSVIGKLSPFMGIKGDKQIKAYLVTESGSIIVVESIGDQTFVVGKRDHAKVVYLTFGINRIGDTEVDNINDSRKKHRIADLLRDSIAELRSEGFLQRVDALFPYRDATYGVQIYLEHHTSLDELLGKDTVAHQAETDGVSDMVGDEDATMINVAVPRPSPPPPSIPHEVGGKKGAPLVEVASQPSRPVPLVADVPETQAGQEARGRPRAPVAAMRKDGPPGQEGAAFRHPDPGVMLTPEEIRQTLERYSRERVQQIEMVAASLSWSRENRDKVMVGEGHYHDTRSGMVYAQDGKKSNKRDNYRLYFKMFPAMVIQGGETKYVNIINISETGAGFGCFIDPARPERPFQLGQEVELLFLLVGQNHLSIRGRIVRTHLAHDAQGSAYHYFGVNFTWPRKRAPMHFIDIMQKTEIFLLAQKDVA